MRIARVVLSASIALAAFTSCSGNDASLTDRPESQAAELTVEPTSTAVSTVESTVVPTVEPTVEPTPTAVPTVEPTATAAPTAQPSPTATATTAPTATTEPTATAVPTTTADRVLEPSGYDGALRALRTESGVMLTVRSDGPPWQVVTPCFALSTATVGVRVEGPVDVLIDPGHGGDETGAVAPNGLIEADVNLRVAERLRSRLVDRGYVVAQTRYSDHRMAIQARAELANALQPRIFVSIHHNGGFPEPVDRPGTEIFVQHDDPRSARLGGLLFEELQLAFADVDIAWSGTDALGVSWRVNEQGTDLYGVLRRTPELVSVLTEAMYMTEVPEAELLLDADVLDRQAEALSRGVVRFLETEDRGSGFIDGLVFRGELGTGGGTDGCVDPVIE